MIAQLRGNTGGIRGLGKVDKIYLDNTNLIYSLSENTSNKGNIRETFFLNQMRVKYDVFTSPVADFLIGDKILNEVQSTMLGINQASLALPSLKRTFEVGGKSKGQKQIEGVESGYIVKDDIENGFLNVVPLWQLGMTY